MRFRKYIGLGVVGAFFLFSVAFAQVAKTLDQLPAFVGTSSSTDPFMSKHAGQTVQVTPQQFLLPSLFNPPTANAATFGGSIAYTFPNGASIAGLTLSNITGSTHCLQANASGVVSGITCPAGTLASVAAGSSNLTVTNGSGPAVTIDLASSPSIAGLTLSGLTASECIGTNGSEALVSATNCLTSISIGSGLTNTGSGATPSIGIAANGLTNSMLAQMGADTLKGNNTGSTANAADLTTSQVLSMLGMTNAATSASGTSPISASLSGNALSVSCSTCVTAASGTSPISASASGGSVSVSCSTCAVVGTNKTTFAVERLISGNLSVTTSVPFPLPANATSFTATASSFQCTTAASSGTSTFQWQGTTSSDPNTGSPTWTNIGSSQSFTTTGGSSPSSFTADNLTTDGYVWLRVNVTAVGTTPADCAFYLYGTQTIQ